VGALFFLFPGWYLALRTGFFVEQAALSRMARHLHDRRADELLKGEIGDLYVRSAGIFAFCALLWLVLLIAADFLSKHLLAFPILFDRLGMDLAYFKDGDSAAYVARFLWGDPVVVTSALAVALLVYPLGRLAWFLVYVDVRVRRDCWDMELQILQEAERLEGGDLQPWPAGSPGSVAVRAAPLLCLLLLSGSIAWADPPPTNTFGDDAQVSRDFEEILAGPEFRRLRSEVPRESETEVPEWLRKFFDWLADLLRSAGNAFAGLGVVLQSLAYAVLAAICALIIWLVVRAVNRYRERLTTGQRARGGYEEGEADIPPGDLPADEYLRRAAELAERGMFREAIGQLLLGAMSFTERSGLIRFRRGLTHRDYLRALRGRTDQHQALRTIVGVYEPIGFGRRPAQYDHYRTSLDGYQTGFRRLAVQVKSAEEKP
jgi:hypothetical protein